MKAVSIKFHALPTSRNIEQDFAMRCSSVSIADAVLEQAIEHPEGLVIVGVYVDGLPQWTVPKATPDGLPFTVSVRPPLLQQGERVEVRCLCPLQAPTEPVKALQRLAPAYPTPEPSYGLTAPESHYRRPLQ